MNYRIILLTAVTCLTTGLHAQTKEAQMTEKAKAVIAKAFPDRDIIGIDASTVVRQHGSLHCLTMQFPAD